MKWSVAIGFMLLAISGRASESLEDTLLKKTMHVAVNWFEFGTSHSFPQAEPGGTINEQQLFFSGNKKGMHHGYLGVTIYYKRFGFGCMYGFYAFHSTSSAYTNYLKERYSGYYVPESPKNYAYTMDKLMFNVSYRIPFKWFFLEPKFRLGLHAFRSQDYSFDFKQKGSNQHVKLGIDETIRSAGNSYHAGLSIMHQFGRFGNFGNCEAGIQSEFIVVPVTSTFTFTESSYELPETHNTFEYQRWNPAFSWSMVLNMYF